MLERFPRSFRPVLRGGSMFSFDVLLMISYVTIDVTNYLILLEPHAGRLT